MRGCRWFFVSLLCLPAGAAGLADGGTAAPSAPAGLLYSAVMPLGFEGLAGDTRHIRVDVCLTGAGGVRKRLGDPDRYSAGWLLHPSAAANGRSTFVTFSGHDLPSIVRLDLDSNEIHMLVRNAHQPAASPAGDRIAYVSRGNLFVAEADGSGAKLLAPTGEAPAWSPDGRELAFVDGGSLRVASADGASSRTLVSGNARLFSPDWSPDGDEVAFVSRASAATAYIEAVAVDGSDRRRLRTARASAPTGMSGISPSWSPDGKQLAFAAPAGPGQPTDIFVMSSSGEEAVNATRTPYDEFDPSWPARPPVAPSSDTCGLAGTVGADSLVGTDGFDVAYALSGDDRVEAGGDDDIVVGGAGRDRLILADGGDVALGGPGDDRLDGGRGSDELAGGPGNDIVAGGESSDFIGLGDEAGDDVMDGGAGADEIAAGPGRDRIRAGSGSDRIFAGDGADWIDARDDDIDVVRCGRGRDVVLADRRDRVHRAECERIDRR